jgi:PTS system mannose-specific IID component
VIETAERAPEEPVAASVRRLDLARAASRSLQIQALLTPERMQGPGFAFCLVPALRRLYPSREALAEAVGRHMGYFATHPVLSGIAIGAAARLEERRAGGGAVSATAIEATKRALMGPLAALGDSFYWLTLRPFSGLVGVLGLSALSIAGFPGPDWRVVACPLLTLLTYNAVALPMRIRGVARGYEAAREPAALLRTLHLAEWNAAFGAAGAFGYGVVLMLVLKSLDLGSGSWGADASARAASVIPLLSGAAIGAVGARRWPGRGVEVALFAIAAAFALSFLVGGPEGVAS